MWYGVNMNTRNKAIIVIVLGVATISVILFQLFKTDIPKDGDDVVVTEYRGIEGEALDVALDFAQSWFEARTSTTSGPYQLGLVNQKPLSIELGQKLHAAEAAFNESKSDPVLCQSEIGSGLRAKAIFTNTDAAQIIIFPKEKDTGIQSIFTLEGRDNLWQITDIACGTNEQGPDLGEFTFSQEGFLLKSSLKSPLDSNSWHLVFVQGGVPGHTAPLILDAESICLTKSSTEEVCTDSSLYEAMKVVVKGSLSEAGVIVKRIEIVK